MNKKCKLGFCNNVAKTRGVCKNHYSYIAGLVRKKKTSWRELENKEVVEKKSHKGRIGRVASFLREKGIEI